MMLEHGWLDCQKIETFWKTATAPLWRDISSLEFILRAFGVNFVGPELQRKVDGLMCVGEDGFIV